ncbi:hypothetical protein C8N41_102634 [Winogradskyella sediminis]|nr:hypothetical protein C8N41_102634 [Winogradskyella sediminis]
MIGLLKKYRLLIEVNESSIGKTAQCIAQINELDSAMRSKVLFFDVLFTL